jgi:hypothetical protein
MKRKRIPFIYFYRFCGLETLTSHTRDGYELQYDSSALK